MTSPVDSAAQIASSAPVRLLAVDGNSLAHRAFHSVKLDPGHRDPRPLTTGAVVSMLATAWTYGPYDGVVVGFDHPVNRRKIAYPEYKANRPPTPVELTEAIELLREHLTACGVEVVLDEGAEGDDLVAAVVDACDRAAWACDVLSSDRDLTALVSPSTRLLRPRARFADLLVEDEASVRATYGIEPWQYTELAALRGDPSDGLTGATGIGPKTAARLLRDYGSVMGLYDVVHELHPRVEASLREARDRVERNLELMAPIPHLALDTEVARAADGLNLKQVAAVLDPLGLQTAARRLARAVTNPAPPPPPPSAHPVDDLNRAVDGGSAGLGMGTAVRTDAPRTGEQSSLW